MSQTPLSQWSREEKEEWATKRMKEMKLKNEKLQQRYAEVEKDRIEAERQFSAVTAIPKNPLQKKEIDVQENLSYPSDVKAEREWDIGKSVDGDWSLKEQEYNQTRTSRRRGYEERRDGKDSNWTNRDNTDNRNSQWSQESRKTFGKNRGNYRQQDSYRRNSSNFHSENANSHLQTGGRSGYKTRESSHGSQNWVGNNRKLHFLSPSFENPSNKMTIKVDSDKVWRDDGLNEVQNKQSRVEKWVKSINSEEWSDNDERPPKSYSSSGQHKGSKNYERPQHTLKNDRDDDNDRKQQFNKNTKFDKKYDHSSQNNSSRFAAVENSRKSSTSDSSRREDKTNFNEKNIQRYKKDNYQNHYRVNEHPANVNELDHHNHRIQKRNNIKYNQCDLKHGSKPIKENYQPGFEPYNYADDPEAIWGKSNKPKPIKNKDDDSIWNDHDGDVPKESNITWGETWSDQEDICHSNTNNKSKNETEWNQESDQQKSIQDSCKTSFINNSNQKQSYNYKKDNYNSKWDEETGHQDSKMRDVDKSIRKKNGVQNTLLNSGWNQDTNGATAWKNKESHLKINNHQKTTNHNKSGSGSRWDQEIDYQSSGGWNSENPVSKSNFCQKQNKSKKSTSSSGWDQETENQDSSGIWNDVQLDDKKNISLKQGNSDSWINQGQNNNDLIPSGSWIKKETENRELNAGTWNDQESDFHKDSFNTQNLSWTENSGIEKNEINRSETCASEALSASAQKQAEYEEEQLIKSTSVVQSEQRVLDHYNIEVTQDAKMSAVSTNSQSEFTNLSQNVKMLELNNLCKNTASEFSKEIMLSPCNDNSIILSDEKSCHKTDKDVSNCPEIFLPTESLEVNNEITSCSQNAHDNKGNFDLEINVVPCSNFSLNEEFISTVSEDLKKTSGECEVSTHPQLELVSSEHTDPIDEVESNADASNLSDENEWSTVDEENESDVEKLTEIED